MCVICFAKCLLVFKSCCDSWQASKVWGKVRVRYMCLWLCQYVYDVTNVQYGRPCIMAACGKYILRQRPDMRPSRRQAHSYSQCLQCSVIICRKLSQHSVNLWPSGTSGQRVQQFINECCPKARAFRHQDMLNTRHRTHMKNIY